MTRQIVFISYSLLCCHAGDKSLCHMELKIRSWGKLDVIDFLIVKLRWPILSKITQQAVHLAAPEQMVKITNQSTGN